MSVRARRLAWAATAWLVAAMLALPVAAQSVDGYARMLAYLSADSRIDGEVLAAANGSLKLNQAAGDLNLQANLHGFATGRQAAVAVDARQQHASEAFDNPLQASALIAGNVLAGASGIASINQASGSGNSELNAVLVTLAAQGIREATDEAMATSSLLASAGGQSIAVDPRASRRLGVEASALRGFEGVLQLNQIAGSGNATANSISMAVQSVP